MQLNKTYTELTIKDGTTMDAYIAKPGSTAEKLPAIILLQEAFGVNDHIRNVADNFASEGYIVISPELYHRTAPKHWEGNYSDFQGSMPHYAALTNETLISDLTASFEWLTSQQDVDQDRIFSIGFCLGGKVSILANATLPIRAGISYYAARGEEMAEQVKNLNGPHLFFWGGLDQHIPDENINKLVAALDEAKKVYTTVKISNADHGFNCDQRPSYNATASRNALALTFAFMKNS